MTAYHRADFILRQARERPAAERASFLAAGCAGDEQLRQTLTQTLATDGQRATLPATQADTATPTLQPETAPVFQEAIGQTLNLLKSNASNRDEDKRRL